MSFQTQTTNFGLCTISDQSLAPDAFLLVLDSESDTKDVLIGKGPLTVIRQLSGRARRFTQAVRKAEGHLKRLGDENERERARLWADLAKTARKQEVWDVCRVASRFCLLYDDGRWKNPSASPSRSSPKLERAKTSEGKEKEDEEKKTGRATVSQGPSVDLVAAPLYDKDLIRILAEVNFIQGEALVHLLRTEGVQLNDQPIPPEDKSKHPKGYVAKKPEEDPDWIEYCDWISYLSETSTASFLQGLSLGLELNEAWLVCSAVAYIWNYNNHVLTQNRHREIIETLQTVLDGMKKVGHAGETIMLVNICNALAFGLLKPWLPPKEEPAMAVVAAASPSPRDKSPRSRAKPVTATGKPKATVTISPDAMPDLKKAIEVCEYAMRVTNGCSPTDVVPVCVRTLVLQTWVLAKQMAQQQISKSCSADDEGSTKTQRQMTRAIIATEMLCLSKNDIMEFKDTLSISEIAKIVEECQWPDQFIELQLWSRLTYMAYLARAHDLVMHCSQKALRFATSGTVTKGKNSEAQISMIHKLCSNSWDSQLLVLFLHLPFHFSLITLSTLTGRPETI
ncbi:cilia- and flagella-associated protein 46-like [Gigantopelta aegis]|uniref:cilia- and flagella-associated protein 46-like n=1 Tax=Gigantopelta aegis TaxID=1735272 RepID=UPI001B888588|nr:cilia- and flagella-associated protein 46-like [Gigantopelta aegis]